MHVHRSLNKSIEANNEEPKAINFLHDYYLPTNSDNVQDWGFRTGELQIRETEFKYGVNHMENQAICAE